MASSTANDTKAGYLGRIYYRFVVSPTSPIQGAEVTCSTNDYPIGQSLLVLFVLVKASKTLLSQT